MTGYLLLLCTVLLTGAGQIFQKQAAQRLQAPADQPGRLASALGRLACAVVCLALGMATWLGVLQRLPVGLAYPMLSLNFVMVALASRCIFDEMVSARHWRGIAVIMLGIVLMGIGQ